MCHGPPIVARKRPDAVAPGRGSRVKLALYQKDRRFQRAADFQPLANTFSRSPLPTTASRPETRAPLQRGGSPAMSVAFRARTRARLSSPGVLCLAASCVLTADGRADEAIDLAAWGRIRDLGFNHSKVMDTARHLTDGIGPRLTNSPNARKASAWTRATLAEWGLASAHLEGWGPFGRGWSLEHVSLDLLAPDHASLVAVPKAWTPGTAGVVRGKAVKAKLESDADLETWRGKLAGTFVLLG